MKYILFCIIGVVSLIMSCTTPFPASHPATASPQEQADAQESPADTFPTIVPTTVWNPTPTVPPTPTLPPTPTSIPSPTPASRVLDTSAQTAAFVPDHHADIANPGMWDHYRITATLDPENLTVSGNVEVQVTNHTDQPLDTLIFHLYPNHSDFGGGSLWVSDVVQVDGQDVSVFTELAGVLLTVPLPAPMAPNSRTVVSLPFRAHTPYQSSANGYGAFTYESGVWTLASFYPVLAVLFNDGWDRRAIDSQGDLAVTDTALYDVTLDVPAGWSLITTGSRIDPGTNDTPVPDGMQRKRFVSGPQRDFFVAAFQELEHVSMDIDGTTLISYYQPGNATAGQYVLDRAAQAWQSYTAHYGSNPLAEVEIVQVALTNFLGVEYPGVVLIDQELYWNIGHILETTVAHEVAHQWWYNMVGNDAKGQPWLDEGLASFSQIIYYESLGDSANAAAEVQTFRNQYGAARDAGLDGVVNQPTAAFQGNYITLVYAKSALFFVSLRSMMGDEAFFRFLQDYYATYSYRMATGDALIARAQDACECDVSQVYTDWVLSDAPVEVP